MSQKDNDPKKKILANKPESLKGFEEALDLIIPPSIVKGGSDDFELYNYLEKDTQRILKIQNFVLNKVKTASQFSQAKKLIDIQKENVEDLKHQICLLSLSEDSPVNQHLEKIFDSAFKQHQ